MNDFDRIIAKRLRQGADAGKAGIGGAMLECKT
jgi:hypothetical protein